MSWHALDLLAERFGANCRALGQTHPQLAAELLEYRPQFPVVMSVEGDQIQLGVLEGQCIRVLPCRTDAAGAHRVASQLFPGGACTDSVLVAGIDQGWLWHFLYQMECKVPARNGYRPPLYFIAASLESLWIALHLHDWREMLGSGRACLAAGAEALQQLQQHLVDHPRLAIPRLSVTLDPAIWPEGGSLDRFNEQVLHELNARAIEVQRRLVALYRDWTPQSASARLAGPGPLKVLGFTSRFTSFLKYSMKDWLSAFEARGDQVELIIEEADHEHINTLVSAEVCERFKPDLILLIDHYRAELKGLPEQVPCVMWIQDYLPSIFCKSAGAAQGPLDFVIGYNRSECTSDFGYPYSRFMPSMVVVNEDRFSPPQLTPDQRRAYECDVCYVSHASTPAQAIIQEQIKATPHVKRLIVEAFERLKSIYDQGQAISHPLHVRSIVEQASLHTRITLEPASFETLVNLFTHRVNNALLRHQALEWAADAGIDLRIYGNGWEHHPTLARFARGPADNDGDLRNIFTAARINLQATPHGAVHQRLLEGLSCEGFFLIRQVPGDLVDRIYRPLWAWCQREAIQTDQQIRDRATPQVGSMIKDLQRLIGLDPFRLAMPLIEDIRTSAELDFCRGAGELWLQYDQVVFNSRAELHQRISYYLAHEPERMELAQMMRKRVLERLTYKNLNGRMLKFIAGELSSRAEPVTRAA